MCAEITLFIGNLHTTVTNVSNCTLGVIRHRSCYVLTEIFMHGCSSVGPLIERVSYILCIHPPTQATMGKMNGFFFFTRGDHTVMFSWRRSLCWPHGILVTSQWFQALCVLVITGITGLKCWSLQWVTDVTKEWQGRSGKSYEFWSEMCLWWRGENALKGQSISNTSVFTWAPIKSKCVIDWKGIMALYWHVVPFSESF